MLPLNILSATQSLPLLVEIKSGDTFNGHLKSCDTWMNLTLQNVVRSSADGTRFLRLAEAYIRGNNIKYMQIPKEVLVDIKNEQVAQREQRDREGQGGQKSERGGRGDFAARGGGGGDRGGRGRGGSRGDFRGGRGGRGRGRGA